ncbi:hypothetical protein ABLE93_15555 [Xanthobacter sp. KR7-65]|uniref:hypothetical protein n=1 Tax=Xanthobacter sp. KR7-65 TaxID=3156612 RepID=UPI0032B56A40
MRFAPFTTFAAPARAGLRMALSVSLALAAVATVSGTFAIASADRAEAQTTKRNRIVVERRSYLDAGTVVKPGSKSYLDYALPPGWFYPGYGQGGAAGPGPITGMRWPLPGQFDLPGY